MTVMQVSASMNVKNEQRKWLWMGVAAIVVLTCVAYLPAMSAGFIWDDDAYVTENALLRDLDGLGRIWIPRQTPQYYPAVFTTFWIEHQVWGLNPTGYHLVNILLHALNAILVWHLCRSIGVPGGDAAGWLIAAIFALHPVHVESVAWITERKNVLSALFYLLSMHAYLKFDAKRDRASNDNSGLNWWQYAIALVLFVLALLSKTVTCSLPAALLLIFLYQRKTISVSRIAPLIPFFTIGIAMAMLTVHLERAHVGAEGERFVFTFADRLIIASQALLFYPLKIVWPWPLIFIYPRWTIDTTSIAAYWGVVLVIVITIATVVAYLRNWRGPVLALAFYAGTIFPALGFFNIYPMLFSFVADHFQYLASLGVIVLIVGGAAWLLGGGWRLLAVGSVPLLVFMIITVNQTTMYADAETLWSQTIARNERAWVAHNNLSKILLSRGIQFRNDGKKAESDQVMGRGYQHLCRAMELNYQLHKDVLQTDPTMCLVMGAYYDRKNLLNDAIDHYIMYLRRFPESNAYLRLGDALQRAGRLEHAVDQLRNASGTAKTAAERQEAQGKLASSLLALAQARANQGDHKAADEHAREAATLFDMTGMPQRAAEALRLSEMYRSQMK